MKKIFLAAAAVFASIPGLLIIAKGLGTPPNYEVLFGGVIEAFGVIALLTLWINKSKLEKIPTPKITRIVVGLSVVLIFMLFAYLYLYNQSVVTIAGRGTAYYPVYLTGEIAQTVNEAGSRKAAIERYGIDEILEEINKMPDYYLTLTTVILLFTYQWVFTVLTVIFGLIGFHKGRGFSINSK